MVYLLTYFEDAKIDIRDSKTWYKNKKNGLEKHFAEVIKTTIINIQQNPFIYALRYRNIRIAYTKTFPYGVHFYINEQKKQIIIIAIIHNSRNPNISTNRI